MLEIQGFLSLVALISIILFKTTSFVFVKMFQAADNACILAYLTMKMRWENKKTDNKQTCNVD